MSIYPRFASAFLVLASALLGTVHGQEPAQGQEATSPAPVPKPKVEKRAPTKFVRIEKDEFDSPVALQTATAKYVLKGEDGQVRAEVVLEGVIHIGDRSYFQAFNRRFAHYDAVLYELVAQPDQQVPKRDQLRNNPLALVQQLAADGLGLTHQVSQIDYEAENLIHSDLSPEEMTKAMRERGDDPVTMLADTVLHWTRQANKKFAEDPDAAKDLSLDLSIFSDPNGTVELRRKLAAQFTDDGEMEGALAPRQRLSLIQDRNDRAMQVFQEQLDAGHRRIAFFWGAGHMADFEQRLILEYGMQPAGVIWRNAWDLREGAVERPPFEAILKKTLRATLQDVTRDLLPEEDN